jgi:ElaB/YqjD/DUF883 family membrane-anchored ribosome-binding protein
MVSVHKHVAGRKQAEAVTRDHQKLGRAIRDTAQDTVEQLHAGAADLGREGRNKMEQAGRSFEQYVREQPLKSVLIAAGVGLVLGRFWMRR